MNWGENDLSGGGQDTPQEQRLERSVWTLFGGGEERGDGANTGWFASTFTLASLNVACATYPPPYLLYIAAYATVSNASTQAADFGSAS